MLVFQLSMINDDASSRQITCSLLDFYYFPVHWFLESGVLVVTCRYSACCLRAPIFGWYNSDTFDWSMLHNNLFYDVND